MTIDERIDAIEQRVCVRKIWRCQAGWGMMFVEEEEQIPAWRRSAYKTPAEVVYRYYPTVEACVAAEYERVVANVAYDATSEKVPA